MRALQEQPKNSDKGQICCKIRKPVSKNMRKMEQFRKENWTSLKFWIETKFCKFDWSARRTRLEWPYT